MPKNLTPKKRKAIEALLTAGDISEAAKAAGCSRDTLYRWLKEADFRTALDEATTEALAGLSRSLVGLGDLAATTLRTTMQNQETAPGVRVRAAGEVLTNVLRMRELLDLETRIAALEAAANVNRTKN